MSTDTIESPPDTRTRAERRQAWRASLNPRTYLSIRRGTIRRSQSAKAERLPFDEFKHAGRSRYTPHVGAKQLVKIAQRS